MEVKLNHKRRDLTIHMDPFESQVIWDLLCQEEFPEMAELEVHMSNNTLTVCRKENKDDDGCTICEVSNPGLPTCKTMIRAKQNEQLKEQLDRIETFLKQSSSLSTMLGVKIDIERIEKKLDAQNKEIDKLLKSIIKQGYISEKPEIPVVAMVHFGNKSKRRK